MPSEKVLQDKQALVANLTEKTQSLTIDGVDLKDARFYILGENGALAWAPHAENIENNTVMLIEF